MGSRLLIEQSSQQATAKNTSQDRFNRLRGLN